MTKLTYIEHPGLYESPAQITSHGKDSKGSYLVLNQSVFYPQGGGQPADQGQIITKNGTYAVFDVRRMEGEVRHYVLDNDQAIPPGGDVALKVDEHRRTLNSKYHTAGHLIAAVAEKLPPTLCAIKGHQFPGEAYVEFTGVLSNTGDFLLQLAANIKNTIARNATVKTKELSPTDVAAIATNLPYALPTDKALRVCHIEGFPPVPCGGTHVETLQEIVSLTINKCTSKGGKTKVYYEVL